MTMNHCFDIFIINFYFLFKVLTTLNLEANQIGVQGAAYLSGALKFNTVRKKKYYN